MRGCFVVQVPQHLRSTTLRCGGLYSRFCLTAHTRWRCRTRRTSEAFCKRCRLGYAVYLLGYIPTAKRR